MDNNIIQIANTQFGLQATEIDLVGLLSAKINQLILHDFNRLISILYRADIDEQKLNNLLHQNKKEDAGKIIAALYLQRQIEKATSRAENKMKNDEFFEEEKW